MKANAGDKYKLYINLILQRCSTFGLQRLTSLALQLESYAEGLERAIVLRHKFVCMLDKNE